MALFQKLGALRERPLTRYFAAVVVSATAVLLRYACGELLQARQPFVFGTIAVMVVAIYLGLGPALFSLALSLVLTVPIIVSPWHSMRLTIDEVFGLLGHTIAALTITLLANNLRKARDQAFQRSEEVRFLNEELEERVEARTAELQAANADLAGFTDSIAHDMRQYLRGINVAALHLLEDFPAQCDEEAQLSLESLSRNARQANELADGLLEFSRLSKNELNTTETNFSGIASEVASRIAKANAGANLHIVVEPGVRARADARLLQVLLLNLVENAAKYRHLHRQTHIEVGAALLNGERAYYVKDDGIGFEMKYAEHIFLPFERLHRSIEFPGSGVGLANVRRIVEKHGGRVWAESEPGKGSTFYFTLGETPAAKVA